MKWNYTIKVGPFAKIFTEYTRAISQNITNKKVKAIDFERSEDKYEAKIHISRIFGCHVTNYINHIKKEDPADTNSNSANEKNVQLIIK
jgi:hypothetical protein